MATMKKGCVMELTFDLCTGNRNLKMGEADVFSSQRGCRQPLFSSSVSSLLF